MLRITGIESLVRDLIYVIEDNIVNNKPKSILKPSSRVDFLTLRASLVFAELKQAFIEIPNLHHFNLEYHI